ncbi:PAS domain-containing protein [Amycolatopsis sp. NPDC054798]
MEFQAAQIIAALRQVLLRLIGAGASAAGERSQVRSFLQRAKEDRSRAERLAEEAQAVLDALGAHIAAADLPAGDPVLSSDSLLLDIPAGLAKVQRLLAEQDAQLSSWEYAESLAEAAARLSLLYVDAPMPVAILDDDRFLWANTPFEQLVRYSAGELSRMRWTDVVRGWDPDEDHLVCPREGDLCNVQVQRWTVSGCEIAVVHNPLYWEKYGIPSEKWAKQYLRLSGIARNGKICAARFSVDGGSFSGRVRFEAEIAYQYSRAIFRLVADGQLVVQLGGFGRYLVIFSGQRADLGELPDLARLVPEEFRIDATVDRGEDSGLSMDELLWDLETSSRWAKAAESSKLWTVLDPVFRGAEPAAAGELSFRPMIDGDGDLFCVEVVNAISADIFLRALRVISSWAEKFWGPHVPEVEFSVTPEELRRRDWRTLVKFGKYLDKKIKLVLDELRDFETYALLRRFEFVGSVAVRRVALGDDAREILGVPAPLTGLKAGSLTDADGIEKLIAALRR